MKVSPSELRQQAEQKLKTQAASQAPMQDHDLKRLVHELQVHEVELEMQNTELRLIKLDLEAARDSYFELYERAPVGYITLNRDDQVQRVNRCALELLGQPKDKVLSRSIHSFLLRDDIDLYFLYSRRALETAQPLSFEVRFVHPDGTPFWVQMHASLQSSGEFWIVISPSSERKRLEQALRKSQEAPATPVPPVAPAPALVHRRALLGGSMRYDFQSLLEIIKGYAAMNQLDLASSRLPGSDMEVAVRRAAELCHQVLACEATAPVELRDMPVSSLLEDAVKQLPFKLPKGIKLKTDFSPDAPHVLADAGLLQRAFHNLLYNAVEALNGGKGQVLLSVSRADVTQQMDPHDVLGQSVPPGRYACIDVSDSGHGWAPEQALALFEPFFSTKSGRPGLGLAAVLGITTAHRGHLTASSRSGKGSQFRMYLPALPDSA